MDEKVEWLKGQIDEWKKNLIIDEETASRINNYYLQEKSKNNPSVLNVLNNDYQNLLEKQRLEKTTKPSKTKNTFVVPLVLSIISAVLIGAGIISLIAYNWVSISRVTKTVWAFIIALIPAVLLIPSFIKPEKQGVLYKQLTKELLASLWVILAGGAIEFLCQIYLLPMSWETVFLLWFLISCLVFITTRSYGAHGLTAILLVAYCFSTKQIFPFIPLSSLIIWYGLKNKKQYFSIVGASILVFVSIFLCLSELWTFKSSLPATVIFYLFVAAAVLIPVVFSIKYKKVGYELSTIIPSVVVGIFFALYNLHSMETAAVNAPVVLLIIVLVYTLLFAPLMKEKYFLLCAPVLFFMVCITAFNYVCLSILICIYLLFTLFTWRNAYFNEKSQNLIYLVSLSCLSCGYFAYLFIDHKQVLICNLSKTTLPVLQLCLLILMGTAGICFTVLAFIKIWKDRKLLIQFIENLFLYASLFGLLLYGYFGNVNTEILRPLAQIILISLMLYSIVRINFTKNHNFVPFVVMGLLSLVISNFDIISNFDYYGPYFIFLFAGLGSFLQNKKTEKQGLNNFGKVLFALALFIGIFEVYNKEYYYNNQIKALDYILYNFSVFFVFAMGVLRPFILSLRKKKSLNYIIPIYGLFITLIMFIGQFKLSDQVIHSLDVLLPIIGLLFVVTFCIYEIIFWFKRDSVAGVNISAIYLVFSAFVKFFMSTNDLIARGVAFIFCGVIVLVTNAVLSNYMKAKEKKNED